jgi:hypothetical protein
LRAATRRQRPRSCLLRRGGEDIVGWFCRRSEMYCAAGSVGSRYFTWACLSCATLMLVMPCPWLTRPPSRRNKLLRTYLIGIKLQSPWSRFRGREQPTGQLALAKGAVQTRWHLGRTFASRCRQMYSMHCIACGSSRLVVLTRLEYVYLQGALGVFDRALSCSEACVANLVSTGLPANLRVGTQNAAVMSRAGNRRNRVPMSECVPAMRTCTPRQAARQEC